MRDCIDVAGWEEGQGIQVNPLNTPATTALVRAVLQLLSHEPLDAAHVLRHGSPVPGPQRRRRGGRVLEELEPAAAEGKRALA